MTQKATTHRSREGLKDIVLEHILKMCSETISYERSVHRDYLNRCFAKYRERHGPKADELIEKLNWVIKAVERKTS